MSYDKSNSNVKKELHFAMTLNNDKGGNRMFRVNNRNTRTTFEIFSKLTIKTPERHHWRRSGFFIVNLEQIPHLLLVFLLFTNFELVNDCWERRI